MSGMDMMFANLLGIKPAEIKSAVEQTTSAISAAAKDMAEIKEQLARIEMLLNDEVNYVERKLISDNRNSEQLNGNNTGTTC